MTDTPLEPRSKPFASGAIRLVGELPRSAEGPVMGAQLLRSATLVGANDRAACRGRSRAKFILKPGIVEAEAAESAYGIELLFEGGFLPRQRLESLLREVGEPTAIMAASRITASRPPIANRKSQI